VRTEIEALAVRWSVIKHRSRYLDLDYLKSCVDNMAACVDMNDTKNMRKNDMAFHLAIVQGAHSESLAKAWHSLGNYYWTYIAVYYDHAASLLNAQVDKHRMMYEAIAGADINAYAHVRPRPLLRRQHPVPGESFSLTILNCERFDHVSERGRIEACTAAASTVHAFFFLFGILALAGCGQLWVTKKAAR